MAYLEARGTKSSEILRRPSELGSSTLMNSEGGWQRTVDAMSESRYSHLVSSVPRWGVPKKTYMVIHGLVSSEKLPQVDREGVRTIPLVEL